MKLEEIKKELLGRIAANERTIREMEYKKSYIDGQIQSIKEDTNYLKSLCRDTEVNDG